MVRLRDYIANNLNRVACIISILQSTDRPVCLYGGGIYAKILIERFTAFGISIKAVTVDRQYINMTDVENNDIYGIPLIPIDECSLKYENAYVVIAFNYKYQDEYSIEKRAQDCFGPLADIILLRAIWLNDMDFISYDYVIRNIVKFEKTFEMLSDSLSQRIMIEYLNAKISGDPRKLHLLQTDFDNDYELDLVFENERPGIIIECGAFDGRTAKQLAVNGCNKHRIYALEPSADTFEILCKEVEGDTGIIAIKKGASDFTGSSNLKGTGSTTSIDNAEEEKDNKTVEVTTIDRLIGEETVFCIIMDIEGSELSALKGASNTIINNHPNLAIRVYHRCDDLITIPQYINEISQRSYKYYLRFNSVDFGAYDVTLYAV